MNVNTLTPTQPDQEVQPATQIATVNPAGIETRTWVYRVLAVVVLIAIPALYHFGYISKDWINLIGNLLEVLASF